MTRSPIQLRDFTIIIANTALASLLAAPLACAAGITKGQPVAPFTPQIKQGEYVWHPEISPVGTGRHHRQPARAVAVCLQQRRAYRALRSQFRQSGTSHADRRLHGSPEECEARYSHPCLLRLACVVPLARNPRTHFESRPMGRREPGARLRGRCTRLRAISAHGSGAMDMAFRRKDPTSSKPCNPRRNARGATRSTAH